MWQRMLLRSTIGSMLARVESSGLEQIKKGKEKLVTRCNALLRHCVADLDITPSFVLVLFLLLLFCLYLSEGRRGEG